jgi:FkbM family methyltransferase
VEGLAMPDEQDIRSILERVSRMEWDEKVTLFQSLCGHLGEREALRHVVRDKEALSFARTLEALHWNDAWASFERAHLSRLLRYLDVDCVFDVGANRGQYAERLRNEIGFTGHIVSFEPIPELAAVLREKSRNDGKWHVRDVALDKEAGQAAFNVMASDAFSSLLEPSTEEIAGFKDANTVSRSIEVTKSTLDDEVERFGFLAMQRPFLKLDTQGNDLNIVEGGKRCIPAFVGLQSELSIRKIYRGSASYHDSIRRFQELGFEVSALVPNNAGHFPVLVEIDCIMFRPALRDPWG